MQTLDYTPSPESVAHILPGVRIDYTFTSQMHAKVEFSIFQDPRFTSWERMLTICAPPKISYRAATDLHVLRPSGKSKLAPSREQIEKAIVTHLYQFGGIYGTFQQSGEHSSQTHPVVIV